MNLTDSHDNCNSIKLLDEGSAHDGSLSLTNIRRYSRALQAH
jgi:hypothetical protein